MPLTKIFIAFMFALSTLAHAKSTASAQMSAFVIEVPQLKVKKKIWVYLPKNYRESTTDYPVFYMHDAQNLFDTETTYVGEWNADKSLDSSQPTRQLL